MKKFLTISNNTYEVPNIFLSKSNRDTRDHERLQVYKVQQENLLILLEVPDNIYFWIEGKSVVHMKDKQG